MWFLKEQEVHAQELEKQLDQNIVYLPHATDNAVHKLIYQSGPLTQGHTDLTPLPGTLGVGGYVAEIFHRYSYFDCWIQQVVSVSQESLKCLPK